MSRNPRMIVKRNGSVERFDPSKLYARIERCMTMSEPRLTTAFINIAGIVADVEKGLYDRVSTLELDTLLSETCASMSTAHPDHSILAARIAMQALHKRTRSKFSETIRDLYEANIVPQYYFDLVQEHADTLDSAIVDDRDFQSLTYFAYKTLERTYLIKLADGKICERVQHMYMRTALGIHGRDIESVIETYNLLSNRYYVHSTPTLCHAATNRSNYASCYLLELKEDSIGGVMDTLKDAATISKHCGGVGLHVHKLRCKNSTIHSTNGNASGLVPMLRMYNAMSRYVTQGGNKRPGAIAVYLEPWHADVFDFIEMRKNSGFEEARARDLFYALWVPDLFMKRVNDGGYWSLMCPDSSPGLSDCWGEEFEAKYTAYEQEGRYVRRVDARELWKAIVTAQVETGTPYILYKDTVNRNSNQRHLGTIKGSNLCTEIVEYASPDETAVCVLASVNLPKFVEGKVFNLNLLAKTVRLVTRNLNKIIDNALYPIPSAAKSNFKHRPIGIGVQGYADALAMMGIAYEDSMQLNRDIFETIYHAALTESCQLARVHGVYESYHGSPTSRGELHFDRYSVHSQKCDWSSLRKDIARYGLRNSLLVAPMPTATTSQVFGNAESFEPFTSNMYQRRTQSGEFQLTNVHLVRDLERLNLWNDDMAQLIMYNNGSIQNITIIPEELRRIYKTVWEIPTKTLIDMAADRGAYIDQSQSFNLYVAEPTYSRMTSIHFYAWNKGLKTGMYYLRTKSATNAIPFTVDVNRCALLMSQMKAGRVMASPFTKSLLVVEGSSGGVESTTTTGSSASSSTTSNSTSSSNPSSNPSSTGTKRNLSRTMRSKRSLHHITFMQQIAENPTKAPLKAKLDAANSVENLSKRKEPSFELVDSDAKKICMDIDDKSKDDENNSQMCQLEPKPTEVNESIEPKESIELTGRNQMVCFDDVCTSCSC
ncbi:Rr1 [Heliothis zea nudivirus]|uniref:Ribonucleoside-diphosphate reductase n=1 Tax=Heliothis zea nudivirus 1 TaxID=3116536 RepID=Q8JKL8_9VIRU|nr:Rr1 [Heliothis zea nudivirus]AAN04389.1 Rr1 [Heliothis zea nudivirus]